MYLFTRVKSESPGDEEERDGRESVYLVMQLAIACENKKPNKTETRTKQFQETVYTLLSSEYRSKMPCNIHYKRMRGQLLKQLWCHVDGEVKHEDSIKRADKANLLSCEDTKAADSSVTYSPFAPAKG